MVLFDGDKNSFSFELPLPSSVQTADLYFTPRVLNDSTVLMALEFGPDTYWGIRYTLPRGESYVVKMDVVQKNMAPIAQSNNRNMIFSWNQDLKRQEKGRMFEERNSALYYKYAGGSVENLKETKDDTKEREAKIKWIGFKNQFSPRPRSRTTTGTRRIPYRCRCSSVRTSIRCCPAWTTRWTWTRT